ncbi:MAG: helix-turn-helix domain-containing protein [Actinomycetota bacterium]
MDFPVAVGRILRRLRSERRLTLHGVQELSQGQFKASALSGYERGERSISLERFRALTELYSVPADAALGQVLALLTPEGGGSREIDLTEATVDLRDEAETSKPVGER